MGFFDIFKRHANKAADKATAAIPGTLDDKIVGAAKSGMGKVGDAGGAAAGMAGQAAGKAKDAAGGAAGAVGGAASNVGGAAATVADKASDTVAAGAKKVASMTPTDIDDKLVEKAHAANPLNNKDNDNAGSSDQQPPAAA